MTYFDFELHLGVYHEAKEVSKLEDVNISASVI